MKGETVWLCVRFDNPAIVLFLVVCDDIGQQAVAVLWSFGEASATRNKS